MILKLIIIKIGKKLFLIIVFYFTLNSDFNDEMKNNYTNLISIII